jgi:DNA repair protein RadD
MKTPAHTRPYQTKALAEIRAHAANRGKGAILQMPTGSGKTHVFCDVLKGAYAKGKRAIMVVRGKALVHQASDRLTREGVPHGIFQGDNSRDTGERILVCSVDTLFQRQLAPRADLIVIDECHLSTSEGYKWFLSQYPCVFKLGVSATPHHKHGMRHIGDKLVRPASFSSLVAEGYLVGARYFVPYIPDLKGITKTSSKDGANGKDFNAKQLGAKATNDADLTANAAAVWRNNLVGRSALVFAVSVEHAGVLLAGLRGVGARGEIIVANTPDAQRRDYIGGLERGEIDVLVSVGVLTTGVDIPSLRAIVCCRPTDSYNLWVQILGRGTRPAPGKKNFLVYDLSGNLHQHGPIEAEPIADLDGLPDFPKVRLKTCPECYACFTPEIAATPLCPACGEDCTVARERTTGERIHGLTDNDQVAEVKIEPWEIELPAIIAKAKQKGWRKGYIYHLLKAKYGEDVATRAWPRVRAMKKWPTKNQVA